MSKQVLDIEQMKHLQKLGLDTSKASMVLLYTDDEGEIIEWDDVDEFTEKFITLHDAETGNYDHSYRKNFGVFTVQDILDLLPKEIAKDGCTWSASLYIDYEDNIIAYGNTDRYGFEVYHEETICDNIIDALYQMLCWCIKNEYVK